MVKTLIFLAAMGFTLAVEASETPGSDQRYRAVLQDDVIAAQYIVKFRPGAVAAARRAIQSVGGAVVLDLPKHNLLAARLSSAAMARLARNPNIEYIEPDPVRYPLAQTTPYGIDMVMAPQTWDVADVASANLKVCVIDSGYAIGHEDLPTGDSGLVSGSVIGNGLPWNQDGCGHGTHVAGTIAAVDNELGVIGVAPGIELHIVRVFGSECEWTSGSTLIQALDACEAAGAKIVNMSLGGIRKSRAENQAFTEAYDSGILLVAAAGNDGNSRPNYPASYASVISVAAVDDNRVVADFSQRNNAVELAAPGVGVLSTVPTGTGITATLETTDNAAFAVTAMEGSPLGQATGRLIDCGDATLGCPDTVKDSLCLIQRGSITFADKVMACQAKGGLGAIIYNNVPGTLIGTLGEQQTRIPSAGASDVVGEQLRLQVGTDSMFELKLAESDYAAWDGTSMAAPHVSGAAALAWSLDTSCTPHQVRAALDNTAHDLGAMGRDAAYGYGLVNALDAATALDCTTDTGR